MRGLTPLRFLLLVLFVIALTACGSDDPAPAAVPPVTLADGVTVEPGSDEAEIFSLTERLVLSLRSRDAEALLAECHPDLQAGVSVAEFAALIEEDSTWSGYGQPVFTSEMNFTIHDIRKFRDTGTVNYEWHEGEDVIRADFAQSLEKVDGRWYMTVMGPCTLR